MMTSRISVSEDLTRGSSTDENIIMRMMLVMIRAKALGCASDKEKSDAKLKLRAISFTGGGDGCDSWELAGKLFYLSLCHARVTEWVKEAVAVVEGL